MSTGSHSNDHVETEDPNLINVYKNIDSIILYYANEKRLKKIEDGMSSPGYTVAGIRSILVINLLPCVCL